VQRAYRRDVVADHRLVRLDRGVGTVVGVDDVEPDGDRAAGGRQARGDDLRAVVGYPVVHDDRAVRGQPEQPGARVAGGRVRGDRADLQVAEAEHGEQRYRAGTLVEARAQTDRYGEAQPGHLLRQPLVLDRVSA
jgi:hypothetical protein